MKHKCDKCGKTIDKRYKLCYDCQREKAEAIRWIEYMKTKPEERDIEREIYYSHECSACGKEGASERPDGQYFCGRCWMVWNS